MEHFLGFFQCVGDFLYVFGVLIVMASVPAIMALLWIGSISYRNGCDPHLTSHCAHFIPIVGVAESYSIQTETCTAWVKSFFDKCLEQATGDCFNSFTIFRHDTDKLCYKQSAVNVMNETLAKQMSANEFPLGDTFYFLTTFDDENKCIDVRGHGDNWLNGVILLSVGCFIALAWVIYLLYHCDVNDSQPENQPQANIINSAVAQQDIFNDQKRIEANGFTPISNHENDDNNDENDIEMAILHSSPIASSSSSQGVIVGSDEMKTAVAVEGFTAGSEAPAAVAQLVTVNSSANLDSGHIVVELSTKEEHNV